MSKLPADFGTVSRKTRCYGALYCILEGRDPTDLNAISASMMCFGGDAAELVGHMADRHRSRARDGGLMAGRAAGVLRSPKTAMPDAGGQKRKAQRQRAENETLFGKPHIL